MSLLRRFVHRVGNRGVAALEFGLMVPVFTIALAGVVDLGGAFITKSMLDSAVSSAANYALVNAASVGTTSGTINEATMASNVAAIIANTNGTAWADALVSVNNGSTVTITSGTVTSSGTTSSSSTCYCPTGTAENWTWGTAVTCGSACSGGGFAGKFIRITASRNFTPLISGYGIIPSGKLQSSAAVQAQ